MSSSSYARRPSHAPALLATGMLTAAFVLALAPATLAASAVDFEAQADRVGRALPLWTGIPFAGILLSIALFPLLAPHFWHHHYKKVAIGWAMVLFAPFVVAYGNLALYKVAEVLLLDYLPFIILLWGLYTVSGGIFLRATLVATPSLNAGFLVVGTLFASLMGTTGASMLFVRPMLRANNWRRHRSHVFVFFIFLVANIGGLLTPLGDPPLFLGFIHGVPFFWTLRLLPEFLVVTLFVLVVFVALDTYYFRKELDQRPDHHVPIRKTKFKIEGWPNFLLLILLLGAVLVSGWWTSGALVVAGLHFKYSGIFRDVVIVLLGLISIATTPKLARQDNNFNWDAIKEVGYLFFGIFVTIIPVILILRAGEDGALAPLIAATSAPWQYFWMTGALSSFLDNAPTYLTFFNLALGKLGLRPEDVTGVLTGLITGANAAAFIVFLKAISVGAVFMGANTYVGNAPNFMVLSIAKSHGVKMPSFFGYMAWSLVVLIPAFVLVTWVSFR